MINRNCGECDVCCIKPQVDAPELYKDTNEICKYLKREGIERCTVFGTAKRPKVCSDFLCSWVRGHGGLDNHRPNKSKMLISINNMNGGIWVFAMEVERNSLKTKIAREFIIDIAKNVKIPVIVSKYDSLAPNDFGDYTVVKKSLLSKSKVIMGEFLEYIDDKEEYGLYKLRISNGSNF